MKVLMPVRSLITWVELIKLWTGEIYFGVSSDKNISLNLRDALHSLSFVDAEKLIKYSNENSIDCFITLNNLPVGVDVEYMRNEIREIIKLKPDWLIVKDIIIADIIREIDKDINIHCSSLSQIINYEWIEYWIKNYNISRLILPRNVSIDEIKFLANHFPNLEFEIFIKNSWCHNSNWICSSLHSWAIKRWLNYVCFREKKYESNENISFTEDFIDYHDNMIVSHCKVCSIWKLYNIKNIVSLKVVGREKALWKLAKDLKFINLIIESLKKNDWYKNFLERNIKSYKTIFNKSCNYIWCEFYNN